MQPAISTDMHKPFYELYSCTKKIHMKKTKNTITEVTVGASPPSPRALFFQLHFILPDSDNLLGLISDSGSKLLQSQKIPKQTWV